MAIRSAVWDDMPRLLQYLSAFHQASPWAGERFSPGAARIEIQNMILRPSACVFIHDHGAIGGQLTPLRFGSAVVAQETFWWAEKHGLSLLRAFEAWAKENSADLICMASLSGSRTERLYGLRGYVSREAFFVRQI